MNTNKNTQLIPTTANATDTDYYQFTMSYAHLMTEKAYEVTGFESFYRHIRPEVAGDSEYVIFDGEKEVHIFMAKVKEAFMSKDFFDQFWNFISPKLNVPADVAAVNYEKAKKVFEYMVSKYEFKYTVVPNGTKVYPKVPVFQFKGAKMIGSIIETPLTNIVNGKTGFATYKEFFPDNKDTINEIARIMNGELLEEYVVELNKRAKEYRNATDKVLLEAGFRRAPNYQIAQLASKVAIENDWNGTSNTSIWTQIDSEKIGGTMAHAFVMGYKTEKEAFISWNKIFPKSTMLIDTYDSINAVYTLIDNNIRPASVRIDSDPLDQTAIEVRKILDNAGWTEVKIFISGDITPELLIDYEKRNVPFDMCMAGTKYVNLGAMKHVNVGFVYKVVEYEELVETKTDSETKSFNMIKHYPIKKAEGKSNYPGLKTVRVSENGDITMTVDPVTFGFDSKENMNRISTNAEVSFTL